MPTHKPRRQERGNTTEPRNEGESRPPPGRRAAAVACGGKAEGGSERNIAVPAATSQRPGSNDLLHLVVEIKGYRREDAKEKATMDTYWVSAVNNLGTHGRWAFAEFTEIYQIEADFKAKVEIAFDEMIGSGGRVRT